MVNEVRLIGGLYKGRKLSFPTSLGLRPTTSRIRETLFNWLMHDIKNSHCLDLFAGSGALSFEALSRGAESITINENNRAVFNQLKKNSQLFDQEKITLHQSSARALIPKLNKNYDIIFIDPPYASDELLPCLDLLIKHNIATSNTLIYIESNQALALDEKWQTLKQKKAGQVHYALIKLIEKSAGLSILLDK